MSERLGQIRNVENEFQLEMVDAQDQRKIASAMLLLAKRSLKSGAFRAMRDATKLMRLKSNTSLITVGAGNIRRIPRWSARSEGANNRSLRYRASVPMALKTIRFIM
jgi:hypothetical protein